jgi:uncharacterized protein YfaP (DUF2135 family)
MALRSACLPQAGEIDGSFSRIYYFSELARFVSMYFDGIS